VQGTDRFSGVGEEWHSEGSVLWASCNGSSSTAGAGAESNPGSSRPSGYSGD
jgi:hypothetical protein